MTNTKRALAISAPEPRTLDLIFSDSARAELHAKYEIVEADPENIAGLGDEILGKARYIIGQPPRRPTRWDVSPALRSILNVESNLLNNMPYEVLFQRGIHVVTTGQVFAEPVAEIGLGFALALARGIVDADVAFRQGTELWGGEGNSSARLLAGSEIGIVGFGDLGKALRGSCPASGPVSECSIPGCRARSSRKTSSVSKPGGRPDEERFHLRRCRRHQRK